MRVCKKKSRKPVILLLNKLDLLQEKIQHKSLDVVFPEYKKSVNPSDWQEAADFLKGKYMSVVPPGRDLYCHFTCAVDTNAVRVLWTAVRDVLFVKALDNSVNILLT